MNCRSGKYSVGRLKATGVFTSGEPVVIRNSFRRRGSRACSKSRPVSDQVLTGFRRLMMADPRDPDPLSAPPAVVSDRWAHLTVGDLRASGLPTLRAVGPKEIQGRRASTVSAPKATQDLACRNPTDSADLVLLLTGDRRCRSCRRGCPRSTDYRPTDCHRGPGSGMTSHPRPCRGRMSAISRIPTLGLACPSSCRLENGSCCSCPPSSRRSLRVRLQCPRCRDTAPSARLVAARWLHRQAFPRVQCTRRPQGSEQVSAC